MLENIERRKQKLLKLKMEAENIKKTKKELDGMFKLSLKKPYLVIDTAVFATAYPFVYAAKGINNFKIKNVTNKIEKVKQLKK